MNCWGGFPWASQVGARALVTSLVAIVAVWFGSHPINFVQWLASAAIVGEGVLDMRRPPILAKMTPGKYQLAAGLCLLAAVKCLPAQDETGSSQVDKAALLGNARVEDPLEGENNEP